MIMPSTELSIEELDSGLPPHQTLLMMMEELRLIHKDKSWRVLL